MSQHMWMKIQQIGSCGEGVFCSGAITRNQNERKALNQVISKNKEMFDVVRKSRTIIYRLNGLFYNRYRIPTPKSVFRKLAPQEIVRLCLWSAFIIENNMHKIVPSDPFSFNNDRILLDDFGNLKVSKNHAVITLADRFGYFSGQGVRVIIPEQCQSKWVRNLLSSIFLEIDGDVSGPQIFIAFHEGKEIRIPDGHFIENSFWPESEDDCHSEEKDYGNLGKISGADKWRQDNAVLPLWIKNKKAFQDFKFGVYKN